jgi:uncharacterized protein YcbK (DUF882 family)
VRGAAVAIAPLALALLLPTSSARADEHEAFRAKKDIELDAKAGKIVSDEARQQWEAELDARIGAKPVELINIYNQWTKEFLAVPAEGEVVPSQNETNGFLRCRFTNQPTEMDPRLLDVLVQSARHFDANRVNIVSAYRSPKYNLILQKKGRNVSRRSQHMKGKAVDFRIPGVPIRRLHHWVRSLRLGGVGFYTHSRFVHADTGRVRYWTAR